MIPDVKDVLNIVSKGFDTTVFKSLRIFEGMLYCPVAFLMLILDISASISDAVAVEIGKMSPAWDCCHDIVAE